MATCPKREQLQQSADSVLQELIDTTKRQPEALQSGDMRTVLRHDKKLELLVGRMERTFGALSPLPVEVQVQKDSCDEESEYPDLRG